MITRILNFIIAVTGIVFSIFILYQVMSRIVKRNVKNRKSVSICPRCGSLERREADHNIRGISLLGIVPTRKSHCLNCGYEGIFVTIDKDRLNDFRKELKKKNR